MRNDLGKHVKVVEAEMVVGEMSGLGVCLVFQDDACYSEEKHLYHCSGPDLILVFLGGMVHSDTYVVWMAVSVHFFSGNHLYLQICLLSSDLYHLGSLCCLMV